MALNGDALGSAILAAMDSYVATLTDPTDYNREEGFKTLGNAIVDYIKANAIVSVNVSSVSLVQPGVGVSGPGTGTGTIS